MHTQLNARNDDDEILSEREAAKFLNKSVATMRRWRGKRIGPAFCKPEHTKSVSYFKRDLRASVEAGRVEPVRGRNSDAA